jgi:hypothetical protein
MLELLNTPLIYIGLIFLCIAGSVYFFRKVNNIKNAKYIVNNQSDRVSPYVLDQGFEEFKGAELERYKKLVMRVRSQCGHNNVKVGHVAWILHVMDDESVDVLIVDIPSFD